MANGPPKTTIFSIIDGDPMLRTTGPPPAYRTDSEVSSVYSSASTMANMGKRRASWTNLVESDENLTSHRVNQYPRVKTPSQAGSVTGSLQLSQQQSVMPSRAGSQIAHYTGVHYAMPRGHLLQATPGALGPSGHQQPAHLHHAASGAPSVAASDVILSESGKKKRNRLQEIKNWCSNPKHALCSVFLILVIIVGIVAAIVITQALALPKNLKMVWKAPTTFPGAANSEVMMNVEGEQAKFSLRGGSPFKGNFKNVYDFETNRVAIIDEALKQNGKQIACFMLNIDRQNVPTLKDLQRAAQNSRSRTQQSKGWQETWNYQPSPMNIVNQTVIFNPPIPECEGARWIQLEYTSANQKSQKCMECIDFCLPEYGIERDTVAATSYLNIIRRDCFYLFVPEWRSYAQSATMEQNNRDFEQFYRTRNGGRGMSTPETKWINVHGAQQPQRNLSQGQYGQTAGQQVNPNMYGQQGHVMNGVNGIYTGGQQPQHMNNGHMNTNGQYGPTGNMNAGVAQNGMVVGGYPNGNPNHPNGVNGAGGSQQQFGAIQPAVGMGMGMGQQNPGVNDLRTRAAGPMAPGDNVNGHNSFGQNTQGQMGTVYGAGAQNSQSGPGQRGPVQQGVDQVSDWINQQRATLQGQGGAQDREMAISGSLGNQQQQQSPVMETVSDIGNRLQGGANKVVDTVASGVQNIRGGLQSAAETVGDTLQSGYNQVAQSLDNRVNPPTGFFQQMTPQQGGYPGYTNQYLQNQNGGSNQNQPSYDMRYRNDGPSWPGTG